MSSDGVALKADFKIDKRVLVLAVGVGLGYQNILTETSSRNECTVVLVLR